MKERDRENACFLSVYVNEDRSICSYDDKI